MLYIAMVQSVPMFPKSPCHTLHWHWNKGNSGILTLKFCSLLARQHCSSSHNLIFRSLEGCGLESILKETESPGPSSPICDTALERCKSDCTVFTCTYSRQEMLNIGSEDKMWNSHINKAMLWQFTFSSCINLCTHTEYVCVHEHNITTCSTNQHTSPSTASLSATWGYTSKLFPNIYI